METKTRAPWYYYLLCLFLYSVTVTVIGIVASVQLGGLVTLALGAFFLIYLPKQLWEAKQGKQKK